MADQGTSNDEEQGAWARPVSARISELTVSLIFLATGVFFAGFAALLPFGRVGLPGPGFFPLVLGIALCVLSIALFFRTWQAPADAEPIFIGHRDVLIAIVAMIGLAVAFENADSYLVLGTFTAVLLAFLARTSLWRMALGAVLGMVAVWVFFGLALGVRLPTGEFWQQMLDFVTATLPFGQQ